MHDPADPRDLPVDVTRREVWLAERELLAAAARSHAAREAVDAAGLASGARMSYGAAWRRFLMALCNLPLSERPVAVDQALDRLRDAIGGNAPAALRDAAGAHLSDPRPAPAGPTLTELSPRSGDA
jgi:hypothetical protein